MSDLSKINDAFNDRKFSDVIDMTDKALSELDLSRTDGDKARYSFLNTHSFILFVMLQEEAGLQQSVVWVADIVHLYFKKALSLFELGNYHLALWIGYSKLYRKDKVVVFS